MVVVVVVVVVVVGGGVEVIVVVAGHCCLWAVAQLKRHVADVVVLGEAELPYC